MTGSKLAFPTPFSYSRKWIVEGVEEEKETKRLRRKGHLKLEVEG